MHSSDLERFTLHCTDNDETITLLVSSHLHAAMGPYFFHIAVWNLLLDSCGRMKFYSGIVLNMYLKDGVTERERCNKRNLPSFSSLFKWPHQAVPGQPETGASNTIWISHVGDRIPSFWPIFSWFSRHINWSFIGNGAAIPCGSLTCWGCTTMLPPVVLFNPISLFIILTSSLRREKCCMDYALWGPGAHHLLYLQRGTFVWSVSIPVHFLVRC